jgi:hypothetical protein
VARTSGAVVDEKRNAEVHDMEVSREMYSVGANMRMKIPVRGTSAEIVPSLRRESVDTYAPMLCD